MRPKSRLLTCTLAALLALPSSVPMTLAGDQLQPATRPEPFREQLDSLIVETQGLIGTAPVHADLVRQLESARDRLQVVPDGEFERLAEPLSGQVRQLRAAIGELRAGIARRSVEMEFQGTGFPSATYPDVSWFFAIEAFTELGDPPDGEVGETEGGFCSFDNSPTPNDQFLQLNAVLAAEAARETASRVCGIIEDIPAPGGFLALACIITDVLYIVAKGIVANESMCSSFMTDAEVRGSYLRTDHLHGDIVDAGTSLVSRIGTTETDLQAEVDFNETLLIGLDSDLFQHDQEFGTRADWIVGLLDAQQQLLIDQRAENLRNHIERRLSESDHKPVAFFLLPDAHGGKLEVVRQIVDETIAHAAAGGIDIQQAQDYLDQADLAMAQGAFEDAFDLLGLAYRGAVK